jgi:predicted phosphodiesterase
MESEGAIVVQGNTDVAVADADYAAAFPWLLETGVSDAIRLAAEWAHDALDDEQLAWLRRLPAERRVRIGETLVLLTHASPGSQTQGFDRDLDPTAILERIARTDARVICCGHTHVPDVREFGWKVIVNDGSAGYVFDGDPTASWALVTIEGRDQADATVTTEIQRAEFDVLGVANAISARGLPGDVYRAATVRTGKLVR